ncbi:MAG: hypothetical protein H7061_04630 [Bdellovibrionaceae bacterium]|nr:hypothetical protein [Bdellovibrio sp.]
MINDIAFTDGFANYKTSQPNLVCNVRVTDKAIFVSMLNAASKAEVETLSIPYSNSDSLLVTETTSNGLSTSLYEFRDGSKIKFSYFPLAFSLITRDRQMNCIQ